MNILYAAIAFAIHAQPGVAPAEADDPQRAQFATRVGEMLRQVAAGVRPDAAPRAALQAQGAAVQQLINEAGPDAQVHLRPGNQTVMQLRGRALASPAKGAAVLALDDSHEHIARKFFAAHRGLMRLADPDHELGLVHNQRDELGHQHLRFSQQYKGVPVWPAELSAHFDQAGSLILVDGAYVPTPDLDSVKPALSGDDAVIRAKGKIAPGKNTSASKPEFVVYGPVHDRPRLAWKFELTVSLIEAWLVVVDAQDGSILQRTSMVFDAQVQGSGVDLLGTRRLLHVWQKNNTYYLVDTSKRSYNAAFDPLDNPHGVIIIGDAKGASFDQVIAAERYDFVTSTASDLWPVPATVSAGFNFSEVYDYYLERHERNSIDGLGGNISALVGVGHYDNAMWLDNQQLMIFGDARPYAGSLDVVAHELTHGVTQHSAGLRYHNQPGALNEAMSDIFGEMVEARTRGQTDWLIGSDLAKPIRNLKDPGALVATITFRPYPAKMSEYAQLRDTDDTDYGGVHINAPIIGHAFYLLAEGLTGAVGLRSAESIFYRCLTQHLFAQSEFVDCRLGCLASAEELFGQDSTEARMTAQAFDTVEIFAAPTTPEPTPIPAVPGPDSTLFVYYDVEQSHYGLGRREAAQGDSQNGVILADGVSLARPAVTGDGNIAMFVSPDFDLCAVNTLDYDSRRCLGYPGLVHSVAISPDAKFAAFVLRDEHGQPEGKITLLDVAANKASTNNLVAPIADGVAVDNVLYADSMTFTTDSTTLIYDALSQLKFGNGPTVQRWSIYSLHLDSGQTSILVPPKDGVDSGNPAVGRAGNRYVTYDALQAATGASSIMVLDLFTGQSAEVATSPSGIATPAFLGDESGVVYTAADPNAFVTHLSLFKQDLAPDRLHKQGDPTLWYEDANLGVIYRRGVFESTNALPTVTLQLSADQVPAQSSVTLTATATDADGTIARVEFYDGSFKLAPAETAPYTFVWQKVPAGNHLLIARAVDNLGGTKDSSPRFLTVTGNGNKPPTITLQVSSDRVTLPDSVTLTATAADPDGTIARVVFYDGATRLSQADTVPYSFVWRTASPGNHLVTAHAVDNLGAETVSSPRFLTVSGDGNGNALPIVSLTVSADKIPALGNVTLTATASDPDGTIARVEFYDQSTKIGQVDTPPYAFVWRNVPAGNHLITARAIDNLSAETDSSPRFLTVSGTPPGGDKPQFGITTIAQGTVRLTVSGQPGYYIISMSDDLKTWVDIYPVTIEASGVGSIDHSIGSTNSGLFFRVRREP